jgi:hypothetical protein
MFEELAIRVRYESCTRMLLVYENAASIPLAVSFIHRLGPNYSPATPLFEVVV